MRKWAFVALVALLVAIVAGGCGLELGGMPVDAALPSEGGDVVPPADAMFDVGPSDAGSDVTADGQPPGTPDQFGGLRLWLRDRFLLSDAGDAGSDANLIEAWMDQTQDGGSDLLWAGNRPFYEPANAAFNGHDTVGFSYAGGDRLRNPTVLVPQPATVLVVGQAGLDSSYFVDSASATRASILTTTGRRVVLFTSLGNYAPPLGTGNTTNPSIIVGVFSGASSALWVSSVNGLKNLNPGGAGFGGVTVGAYQNGGYGLAGSLAEVAIWSQALDDAAVARLMSYASQRYNIPLQ